MGNRYYITGVQLGMLQAFCELGETYAAQNLIEKIINEQYIGNRKDLKRVLRRKK